MAACKYEHLEIARELLRQGANVNAARTDYAWTPLMYACEKGHLELARLLLAHNASKTAVSISGKNAYDHTPAAHAELRELVKP